MRPANRTTITLRPFAIQKLEGHGLNSMDHSTNQSGFVVSKRYERELHSTKFNGLKAVNFAECKTAVGYFKVIFGRCAKFFCRRMISLLHNRHRQGSPCRCLAPSTLPRSTMWPWAGGEETGHSMGHATEAFFAWTNPFGLTFKRISILPVTHNYQIVSTSYTGHHQGNYIRTKLSLEPATKAQRGSRCIALLLVQPRR